MKTAEQDGFSQSEPDYVIETRSKKRENRLLARLCLAKCIVLTVHLQLRPIKNVDLCLKRMTKRNEFRFPMTKITNNTNLVTNFMKRNCQKT